MRTATTVAIGLMSMLSWIASVKAFVPHLSGGRPSPAWNVEVSPTTRIPARRYTANRQQQQPLFMGSLIQQQEDKYVEAAVAGEGAREKPEVVYIIMYNPGTQQEGVHTTEYPKESGNEVLLAFEALEECVSFTNLLKDDKNFPLEPVPTPSPLSQMEQACQQMGLAIKVVPAE